MGIECLEGRDELVLLSEHGHARLLRDFVWNFELESLALSAYVPVSLGGLGPSPGLLVLCPIRNGLSLSASLADGNDRPQRGGALAIEATCVQLTSGTELPPRKPRINITQNIPRCKISGLVV